MAESHARDSDHAPGAGHERRDISIRPILYAGLGLVAVALVVHVLMLLLLGYFARRESRASVPASPLAGAYGRQAPPQPRLQTRPAIDLRELRAAEDALLSGYAWVDERAGVVRIPIERAMDLLAERGLPARRSGPAAEGGTP